MIQGCHGRATHRPGRRGSAWVAPITVGLPCPLPFARGRRVFKAHVRTRAALLAAGCALALGHRCVLPRPPALDLQHVAEYLGSAAEGAPLVVEAASIQWEASGGAVQDALLGRRVLFLAAADVEAARDVYRARVRVAPDGALLEVNQWRNLTQTPLGDELDLAVHDQLAVFGSRAFGELQALSAFSLDGAFDLQRGGLVNRALLRVRAFQETGAWDGVARAHLALNPSGALLVNLGDGRVALRQEDSESRAVVDLREGRFEQRGDIVKGLSLQHYGGDYWVHTLVDVARDAVGPEPLAWLESHVFHWHDWWRQRSYVQPAAEASNPQSPVAAAGEQVHPDVWPPASVSPLLEPAEPGEGAWVAAGFEVEPQRALGQGQDAPVFAQTWLRPDAKRPYAQLHLIAMDMRRLSLGMEAGFEEPRPKTGPPGRGALPDDVAVRERVVATFNGAFKSIHGDYGMLVDGRLLVPPKPEAASVVVRTDGWVGLGTWPDSLDVAPDLRFFRQNLDPLVAGGRANPTGRKDWGLRLAGGSVVTERSALCRTATGQLYYAWGEELTGETLAKGLAHAGCDYAVHLDMNPGHTGLVFTDVHGASAEGVQGQVAVREMAIHPREHAVWSDKDFFYVLRTDAQRQSDKAATVTWLPSPGPQPPPSSWPAVWSGSLQLGSLTVQLLRVEPGRTRYSVTASTLEPMVVGQAAPRRELAPEELASAVLAVSFGHTTARTRYGMVFGSRVTLPLQANYGNLVVRGDGSVEVVGAAATLHAESKDVVVQLPELVSDGAITAQASLRGGRRVRGAVCVMDGRLWVASVDHDSSDAVAVTLRNLGCRTVLELDRGSKHAVNVQREELSGLSAPERETGYLWALSAAMQPRTFGF